MSNTTAGTFFLAGTLVALPETSLLPPTMLIMRRRVVEEDRDGVDGAFAAAAAALALRTRLMPQPLLLLMMSRGVAPPVEVVLLLELRSSHRT
jgi:hypothetical protein